MLGFLLIIVQIMLFLCIVGLLLLMRKNMSQKKLAKEGAYVSTYAEEQPDYHDHEYAYEDEYDEDDDSDFEDNSHEMSAARRIKSQSQGFEEESQRYYDELDNVQRYAEQEEALRRFTASSVNDPQQALYPPATQQSFNEAAGASARQRYEEESQIPHDAPADPPPYARGPAYTKASYSAEPQLATPPPAQPETKPTQPERKGVLFDDNDDDSAPFRLKF